MLLFGSGIFDEIFNKILEILKFTICGCSQRLLITPGHVDNIKALLLFWRVSKD
jgi:hypothetical protein